MSGVSSVSHLELAYCPAPGPFFRRACGPGNLVANQLHLYTIREGTVRYSPFSKELSNYEKKKKKRILFLIRSQSNCE